MFTNKYNQIFDLLLSVIVNILYKTLLLNLAD